MGQSVLSHQFEVTLEPIQVGVDVLLNIRKRKESIAYVNQVTPNAVNLAYLQATAVSSTNNLFISDHSDSLQANQIVDQGPITFTSLSYTLDTSSFLLTNIFTVATTTQPATPLFYKHLIPVSRFDPTNPAMAIQSFTVLDGSFKPILNPSQVIVSNTLQEGVELGACFNNYLNNYNPLTQVATVYYVKYTIINGSQINTYVEILNNLPVYQLATYNDINSLGQLDTDRSVYILTQNANSFTITMAVSQLYALQPSVGSQISLVRPPPLEGNSQSWFCSTTTGNFFTTAFNSAAIVNYSVPDYNTQNFQPYLPYITVTDEVPTFISGTLYQLAYQNIYINIENGFNLSVQVSNAAGVQVATYTIGNGIRSVDQLNGFLDLQVPVPTGYSITVSYIYATNQFQVTDVDFNPSNNLGIDEQLVVFYVVPQTTTVSNALFYLIVDKTTGLVDTASEALSGDAYAADIASRIATSGLYYNIQNPNVVGPGGYSFINRYTVESTLPETDPVWLASPGFLVLGEVYVGDTVNPDSFTVIDTRIRGGGILNSINRQALLQTNYESIWNWDLSRWDGQAYPGTSSTYVEIPNSILTTSSGVLTRPSVRTAVQRHMDAGTYPVIKFYGADTRVVPSGLTSSGVGLWWTNLGPGITYNIYSSNISAAGPFTKLTSNPVSGICYTVSGLASNTHYWFEVTGIKNMIENTDSDFLEVISVETL